MAATRDWSTRENIVLGRKLKEMVFIELRHADGYGVDVHADLIFEGLSIVFVAVPVVPAYSF